MDRRRGGGDGAAGRMRQRRRVAARPRRSTAEGARGTGGARRRHGVNRPDAARGGPRAHTLGHSRGHGGQRAPPANARPRDSTAARQDGARRRQRVRLRPSHVTRGCGDCRRDRADLHARTAGDFVAARAPARDAGRQPRHDGRPAQPAPPLRARGGRDCAVAHLARRVEPDAADGRRAAAHRSRLHRRARADRVDHAAAEPLPGGCVAARRVPTDRVEHWRAPRRGVRRADDRLARAAAKSPGRRDRRRVGRSHRENRRASRERRVLPGDGQYRSSPDARSRPATGWAARPSSS